MLITGVELKRDSVRARLRLKLIEVEELDLTRTEREAVRCLIRFMIRIGSFEAFRKHEEIAAAVGCCSKTVQRAFDKCVSHKFLGWRQRTCAWARGGRRLLSNLYALADVVAVAAATGNWVDKKSKQRLRLFRLRLKTSKKEAYEVASQVDVQPLVVTPALLRSRVVNRR